MPSLLSRARHRPAAAAFVVASLWSTLALAQQPPVPREPSPAQGQQIAQDKCASCHLLPGTTSGTAPAGPPTFRAIANKPGQTGEHITNILIAPHAPMPDLQLTREEIQDITAYLEELRTDKSGRPLIAPPAGSKPKFPAPS